MDYPGFFRSSVFVEHCLMNLSFILFNSVLWESCLLVEIDNLVCTKMEKKSSSTMFVPMEVQMDASVQIPFGLFHRLEQDSSRYRAILESLGFSDESNDISSMIRRHVRCENCNYLD